jgi:glucosamine--fructose-6-phosphate aminotransferase (isomerizing)
MSGQITEDERAAPDVDAAPGAAMEAAILGQPESVAKAITDNLDTIRTASALVAGARHVRLCGVGASGCAAELGATLLRAIGMDARTSNAFDLAVYPTHFDPAELLIAISHRGDNTHVKRALRRALMSGLKTIGVTGQDSALRGPEIVIATVPRERSSTHTVSLTAAMAVLATLAARVEPRSTLAAALPGLPDALRGMLPSRVMMGEVAEVIARPERRALLVGAAGALAVARAAALALKEAAQLAIECQHLEDALHGGLHGLRPGDVVIQVAPDGPSSARHADLARVCDALGIQRVVIGGQPHGARWFVALPPNAPELFALLPAVVPLHWLALECASAVGGSTHP